MKKPTSRARSKARPAPAAPTAASPPPHPTGDAGLTARLREAMARGAELLKAGRGGRTAAASHEVLAVSPDQPEALLNRGVALRRMGRRDDALGSYLRAIAVAPERSSVWIN